MTPEQIAEARALVKRLTRPTHFGWDREARRVEGFVSPEHTKAAASTLTALLDALEAARAKLSGGVIAEYDDGSTVFLSGYAGGAADGGAWSTLTLMEQAPDGTLRVREYKAQGDWCTTLAEIKGESHD